MCSSSRLLAFVVACLALVQLTPLGSARSEAAEAKVTFVLLNDIYKFDGDGKRGGMARIASVIKTERGRGGPVIVVHAGDFISPSIMSGLDKGAHMVELMNITPVDVFVPGNHEFDHGPEVFRQRMAELKGQKMAANLRDPANNVPEGFVDTEMRIVNGVKIGLIGAALPETPSMSSSGDYRFARGVETVKDEAKKLRTDGANFIVAIVHFDSSDNRRLVELGAVDLILSGHNHDLTVQYNGKVALVESKEEGEYVTMVDVVLSTKEADGKVTTQWWPNFRIQDTAQVTPDAEVDAAVSRIKDDLAKEMDVPLARLEVALDSRKSMVRTQETAMGNLIADAMRMAVVADVALTNGGGIRGNKLYPAGHQLTRRDILAELPFGNKTLLAEIKGSELLAALEHGVGNIEQEAGKMPQVSGMRFHVDRSKPAGSRVSDVMIGDKPLDVNASYKIATNDFMKRGGDGYKMLESARLLMSDRDGQLMANDAMVLARKRGVITTGIEGRITIK